MATDKPNRHHCACESVGVLSPDCLICGGHADVEVLGKLGDKELRLAIRTLPGISLKVSDGEYRVTHHNFGERGAYYTTDRLDALQTARRMLEEVAARGTA